MHIHINRFKNIQIFKCSNSPVRMSIRRRKLSALPIRWRRTVAPRSIEIRASENKSTQVDGLTAHQLDCFMNWKTCISW